MKNNKRFASGNTFSFELETRKNLGQNFLQDESIIHQIVARASRWMLPENKVCLEIGPGSGALTRALLHSGWTVVAIEKDARAVAGLQSSLVNEFEGKLRVIQGDILELNPDLVFSGAGKPALCIGNIPYYITSEIMLWFLKHQSHFNAGMFMIQKEVADRIASEPRCKSYGRLTVRMQLSCQVEQFLFVPASAFMPVPKVDSAVIELSPCSQLLLLDNETSQFEQFTSMLFSARRKMLRKTVTSALHQIFTPANHTLDEEQLVHKAEQLGIHLNQRPEELSPIQILALFRLLKGER